MESMSLKEAFSKSIKARGLFDSSFVGDGDRNFFKRLKGLNPCRDINIRITEIKCTNYLLRNLCKKLSKIPFLTQKPGRSKKDYIQIKKK